MWIAPTQLNCSSSSSRSVPARLVAVLLRLSHDQEGNPVMITHQELGDMIGALRESVTKVLNEFQQAGLITLKRGRILIHDQAGLQAQIEEPIS